MPGRDNGNDFVMLVKFVARVEPRCTGVSLDASVRVRNPSVGVANDSNRYDALHDAGHTPGRGASPICRDSFAWAPGTAQKNSQTPERDVECSSVHAQDPLDTRETHPVSLRLCAITRRRVPPGLQTMPGIERFSIEEPL
jgi:hypothetical protein